GRDRDGARPRFARAGTAAHGRRRRVARPCSRPSLGVAESMRAWLALAVVVLGVAGCGGSTKTVTETTTVIHTTTVRVTTQQAPSSAEACTGDAMSGGFTVIPGSGAAGQIGYRLHVKNDSPVACFVSGLPIVQ